MKNIIACLINYRVWRKVRALDRAVSLLWNDGHVILASKLEDYSKMYWNEIFGRFKK